MIAHDPRARPSRRPGCPPTPSQYLDTPDRQAVMALLTLDRYLDLIIPRGGEELARLVAERAHRARAQARQGPLPRLRRRGRRPRHGGGDRGQRQGAARRACATRPRRCSCTPRSRRAFLPVAGGPARARPASSSAATPRDAGARARRAARHRRRLGHRVPRPDPRGARGRRASTTRWRTSAATAPGSPRRSSPRTCARARRFTREVDAAAVLVNASTRSSTARSSGSARRSASRPPSCTRAGRWARASSPRRSTSSAATARSGSSGLCRASGLRRIVQPDPPRPPARRRRGREALALDRRPVRARGAPPHKPAARPRARRRTASR